MNPWEYGEFIGLKGDNLESFISSFRLAQRAIYDISAREKLGKLASGSWCFLKIKYPSKQNEFEDRLKELNLSHLLKTRSKSKKLWHFFENN
ncbi:MAG: hypothetical protein ACFFDN_37940 [Candidatus Hodarchaeota archaeon]